eukprot:GFUD01031731.1.p1 GENE.GFUD01031731.1~~GFUD01031731.1.p1  ORF type:complete len:476 (-),score=131.34 GFUD01031731.1:170-1597(-)
MANHQVGPVTLTIPEVVTEDGVTMYLVQVEVGEVAYQVNHRYSEFEVMHYKLVEEGVEKDLLPPKKLIGNKDPAFIMKRRRDLENYLQTVYHFLEKNLPSALAEFLKFPVYDIHYVLQDLASECHEGDLRNESITEDETDDGSSSSASSWTPLQMFSISERLKSPCPPLNTEDKRYDFTNVADACCRLAKLTITGSTEKLGSSELVPNELKFDFLAFKSLTELCLDNLDISPAKILSLGILRNTLVTLSARNCSLGSISMLLLCDTIHTKDDIPTLVTSGHSWSSLLKLDLSHNNLEFIDSSLRLAPNLTDLILSSNSISQITNLTGLPHLRNIDLSNNKIKGIDELHTKIGQISSLNLSQNKIRTLYGLSKLYSVTNLDVSHNKLRTLADVSTVTSLPCIERVTLSPNKVNNEVDYRLKVLEGYGGRCGEVVLDSITTTQPEMDKVSVLMALSVAREGKHPTSLFGNLPGNHHL